CSTCHTAKPPSRVSSAACSAGRSMPARPSGGRPTSVLLGVEHRTGSREAGDRDAVGGARDVVPPDELEERDRCGVATVLVAEPDLEGALGGAAPLSAHPDQAAGTHGSH